jgi:hypothetical protein
MQNKSSFFYGAFFFLCASGVLYMTANALAIGGGPVSVCGDGVCSIDEQSGSNFCPIDCNPCGDGICDANAGETPITCNVDCVGSFCGDGTCDNSTEDYITCAEDCAVPAPSPDPGIPTPLCEDVIIHVGAKTTCSIKVENVQTFPLTEVTATVTIPNEVTKTDNTDTWTCVSIATGTQCNKIYNPYLVMGEIEYLELTFTTNIEGEYGLSAELEGKGETTHIISYASSQEVTVVTPPATANAVDDWSMCNSDITDKDLAINDTLCSSGTTTFAYHNVISGVTITSFNTNTGVVSYTFDSGAIYDTILQYDILCNGIVTDTADLSYTCA